MMRSVEKARAKQVTLSFTAIEQRLYDYVVMNITPSLIPYHTEIPITSIEISAMSTSPHFRGPLSNDETDDVTCQ